MGRSGKECSKREEPVQRPWGWTMWMLLNNWLEAPRLKHRSEVKELMGQMVPLCQLSFSEIIFIFCVPADHLFVQIKTWNPKGRAPICLLQYSITHQLCIQGWAQPPPQQGLPAAFPVSELFPLVILTKPPVFDSEQLMRCWLTFFSDNLISFSPTWLNFPDLISTVLIKLNVMIYISQRQPSAVWGTDWRGGGWRWGNQGESWAYFQVAEGILG